MHIVDERLRPPKDRDATIWRFLDFPKFVSLLTHPYLIFSRCDIFDNPFEGMYGASPVGTDTVPWFGLPQSVVGTGGGQICRGPDEGEAVYIEAVTRLRKRTFVSCWHMNEHEPASMWAQYVRQGVGVAIRSTVGRLMDAVERAPYEVRLSEVLYIDYESERPPDDYPLARFIHKRKSFEHEHELRAVLDADPKVGWRDLTAMIVGVDLATLIIELRISPGAPLWFGTLVHSLALRFGLEWPTRRSTLDDCPLY